MSPSAQNAGGGRRVTRWTRELIIEKIREWNDRYGEPPCSADWNPSLARWRAQEWRAERYREGYWPSTNAAKRPFGGSFDAAERVEQLVADGEARVRAALDQAEAAAREVTDSRRAQRAAEARAADAEVRAEAAE